MQRRVKGHRDIDAAVVVKRSAKDPPPESARDVATGGPVARPALDGLRRRRDDLSLPARLGRRQQAVQLAHAACQSLLGQPQAGLIDHGAGRVGTALRDGGGGHRDRRRAPRPGALRQAHRLADLPAQGVPPRRAASRPPRPESAGRPGRSGPGPAAGVGARWWPPAPARDCWSPCASRPRGAARLQARARG